MTDDDLNAPLGQNLRAKRRFVFPVGIPTLIIAALGLSLVVFAGWVITVDDPAIFTKPFTLSTNDYQWIPDQEAEEQICVPSEMIHYMNLIARPSFGTDQDSKSK